jgi:hypothetical protein
MATTFLSLTVNAVTENGRPCWVTTTPAAPPTNAGQT